MIVSRKSWHYRLQDMFFQSEAKTLCGYFWRVFFSPFILAASVFILVFLAASFLPYFIMFVPYWLILKNRKTKNKPFPKDFFIWLHVTAIMFIAALASFTSYEYGLYFGANIMFFPFAYFFLYGYFTDMRSGMTEVQEEKKGPNLMIEYIKAKKQKVCPLIDYVND